MCEKCKDSARVNFALKLRRKKCEHFVLGKKLLDGIPYDEIIDIDFFDFIPETCYAQSKFAALELMDDDEVHIDYDVFIKSKTLLGLQYSRNISIALSLSFANILSISLVDSIYSKQSYSSLMDS